MTTVTPYAETKAALLLKKARENPAWWCEQVLGVIPSEFERFCLESWTAAKSLTLRCTIPLEERRRAAALMLMAFLHLWENALVITIAPDRRRLATGLWCEVEALYRGQKIVLGSTFREHELRCSPTWFAKGLPGDNPVLLQGFSPPGDHLLVIVEGARDIQPETLHPLRALVDSCEHGCFVEVN